MTKKGISFFFGLLSKSNICFWQNDQKNEIPFFGHLLQYKRLFYMYFTDIFAFFFLCGILHFSHNAF